MEGAVLNIVPALLTTWEEWLELHPQSIALSKGGGYSYDPYIDYYLDSRAGILGPTNPDDRLFTKEFVVGVKVNGEARAYPFRTLNETPIVNDSLNGQPVVVVFHQNSGTAAVLNRDVNGHTLTLSLGEYEPGTPLTVVDADTGTTWVAMTGEGLEGPLSEYPLQQLPSHYAFWFAWVDWHPDTGIYGQ